MWINFTRAGRRLQRFTTFIGILLCALDSHGQNTPDLTLDQLTWIGDRIFTNECNRQMSCLVAWNQGEDFPSLGIGHFIWYQAGQKEIFAESFPSLMIFMQDKGLTIPAWINAAKLDSPWPDRESFLADQNSPRQEELRSFLAGTMPEQTAFIIARFERALQDILASTESDSDKTLLQTRYFRVANSNPPVGLYALIDYVNFKGTGVSTTERYQGQGWGLKQVLLGMAGPESDNALAAFVTSARTVLGNRVANAPADRNESRWLTGWNNRLDTYLPSKPGN